MIMLEDDIAAKLDAVALPYRELWLSAEHELGQVAEELALALGWQATDEQPLPPPLQLAEQAADRIATMERQLATYRPKLRGRKERERAMA